MTTLERGYYAVIDPDDTTVTVIVRIDQDGRATKITLRGDKIVRRSRGMDWYDRMFAAIAQDLEAAHRLFAVTDGKCYVCGRRLTDPVSKGRGIGPDCWAAAGGGS